MSSIVCHLVWFWFCPLTWSSPKWFKTNPFSSHPDTHLSSAVHVWKHKDGLFFARESVLLTASLLFTDDRPPIHTLSHTHTVLPYYTPAADQLLPHTVHPHPATGGGWFHQPKHAPTSFSVLTEKPMSALYSLLRTKSAKWVKIQSSWNPCFHFQWFSICRFPEMALLKCSWVR